MKAILISEDLSLHKQLAAIGGDRSPQLAVSGCPGGLPACAQMIAKDPPHLVLVDGTGLDASAFTRLEQLSVKHPQLAVVLLSIDQSPQLLLQAMRAGVREVLSLPLDQRAFSDALDRIQNKFMGGNRHGHVLSFISCKGGSGATFLATNLGHAIASLSGKKVLMIDLNQQFGDAALYMSDKKPGMTVADVCQQIDRLDAAFLESSLVAVSPGFGILAASDDPARSADVTPAHVGTILQLARSHYDFIILDLGRQIDAVTIQALDSSDVVHPVLQLSMPYIRDGRRLIEIFRSLGYPADKIRPVVNRFERGGKLGLIDLERALGLAVAYTVPNGYKAVSDSVNQGMPILDLARGSAVAKCLAEMVGRAAGAGGGGTRSVFGRLFGRAAALNAARA